jgi:integrase
LIDVLGPAYPIKEVTKTHAREFIQKIAGEGFTGHKANHYIRILRALFNFAIDELDVDMKNPFYKMKLLPTGDKRKYIPSDPEVLKVMEKLKGIDRDLFNFVMETGCRINEALRLRTEDVKKDKIVLYTRKAKNSNLTPRNIPRPVWLKVPKDKERVFWKWDDRPRFLDSLVTDLKFDPSWSWHSLRHKAATEWANSGVPLVQIMARLGHTNISTTQIYLRALGAEVL